MNPVPCPHCEALGRKRYTVVQTSPQPKRIGWRIVWVGPVSYACNWGHSWLAPKD